MSNVHHRKAHAMFTKPRNLAKFQSSCVLKISYIHDRLLINNVDNLIFGEESVDPNNETHFCVRHNILNYIVRYFLYLWIDIGRQNTALKIFPRLQYCFLVVNNERKQLSIEDDFTIRLGGAIERHDWHSILIVIPSLTDNRTHLDRMTHRNNYVTVC